MDCGPSPSKSRTGAKENCKKIKFDGKVYGLNTRMQIPSTAAHVYRVTHRVTAEEKFLIKTSFPECGVIFIWFNQLFRWALN